MRLIDESEDNDHITVRKVKQYRKRNKILIVIATILSIILVCAISLLIHYVVKQLGSRSTDVEHTSSPSTMIPTSSTTTTRTTSSPSTILTISSTTTILTTSSTTTILTTSLSSTTLAISQTNKSKCIV